MSFFKILILAATFIHSTEALDAEQKTYPNAAAALQDGNLPSVSFLKGMTSYARHRLYSRYTYTELYAIMVNIMGVKYELSRESNRLKNSEIRKELSHEEWTDIDNAKTAIFRKIVFCSSLENELYFLSDMRASWWYRCTHSKRMTRTNNLETNALLAQP